MFDGRRKLEICVAPSRKRSEMEIKMDGQMILGTGRRAENPYYMERFYVNLYSVEEDRKSVV